MEESSTPDRKALGAFLTARRARLKPAQVGLPTGSRRTPGLRREEVAMLAGMSASWYTWLEQGRDIQVSSAALERLANALRLNPTEAAHLFALASRPPPPSSAAEDVSDGLLELVRSVDPLPAYIRNTRLDILAWNPAVADLFVDFGELEPAARNTLVLTFLHPPYRKLLRDWEEFARGMLRVFCAARAKAADKAPFDQLIGRLRAQSEEFRAWWPEGDVESFDEGLKRLDHPRLGLIDLTYVALTPHAQPNLSLVTYLVHQAG